MTLEDRFRAALERLKDWHLDSVKAQTYGGTTSGTPGPRSLTAQSYPHTHLWNARWRGAAGAEQQAQLVAAIEDEWYALGMSSARKPTTADGVFWGTAEHRRLIARTAGSVRQVARLWGVSKSAVQRYRKEFAS